MPAYQRSSHEPDDGKIDLERGRHPHTAVKEPMGSFTPIYEKEGGNVPPLRISSDSSEQSSFWSHLIQSR